MEKAPKKYSSLKEVSLATLAKAENVVKMGGKRCNVWGKTKRVTGYLQGGSPHPGPAAWQPERGAEWAEAWPRRGRGGARGGAGPRRQHDPARRTPARLRQGECKY